MGKTFQGDQVQLPIMHQGQKPKFASHMEITVSDYSKTELLTCEATNTVSHATITATTSLTVIGELVKSLQHDFQMKTIPWDRGYLSNHVLLTFFFSIFSVHRPLLSASHLSVSTSGRQVFLSGVCWLSEPSLHYMAQEQTTNCSIWQSTFLSGQCYDDLQSSPADRWWLIPVCGGRRRGANPVCSLQVESKLWVHSLRSSQSPYYAVGQRRSGSLLLDWWCSGKNPYSS